MKHHVVLAAALLAPGAGAAEPVGPPEIQSVTITAPRDAEWHTYRHAYKAAGRYERLTRSRPLIQAHMQIRPRAPRCRC